MPQHLRIVVPSFIALALVHCAPDFDALNHGGDGGSVSGADAGGTDENGGVAMNGGRASGGGGGKPMGSGGVRQIGGVGGAEGGVAGNVQAGAGATAEAGAGGTPDTGTGGTSSGGTASGGTASGGAASGGTASGGSNQCALTSTIYTGFDKKNWNGVGIAFNSLPETYISSAFDTAPARASGVVDWSATEGKTCPGAMRLTSTFSAYTSKPETVNGMLDITPTADWTNGLLLHMAVKVENPGPYLRGVQVFVASGPAYEGYLSTYINGSNFTDSTWHDVTLSLDPGSTFYPASVKQIGIQAQLTETAPTAGPDSPPVIVVYMDDVWVEF